MSIHKFGSLAIALTVATPAIAIAEKDIIVDGESKDPERIVCKKAQVSGSRLGSKKVCMSAAQWDIRRQADREAIQRAQINRKSH